MALNASFDEGKASLAWMRIDSPEGLAEARQLYLAAIALAPAREDYHLNLARVLMMQSNYAGARSILGPLLARGSSPNVRSMAREYLALAAKLENEASAANGAAESAASSPAALTAPLPSIERPRELADSHGHARPARGRTRGSASPQDGWCASTATTRAWCWSFAPSRMNSGSPARRCPTSTSSPTTQMLVEGQS